MEKEILINLTKELSEGTGIKEDIIKILLIKNKENGIVYEESKKILKKVAISVAIQKKFWYNIKVARRR